VTAIGAELVGAGEFEVRRGALDHETSHVTTFADDGRFFAFGQRDLERLEARDQRGQTLRGVLALTAFGGSE
jgi:hypothetical protein